MQQLHVPGVFLHVHVGFAKVIRTDGVVGNGVAQGL